MPAIHYLSELDKVNAFFKYKPIIMDLDLNSLRVLVLLLLNGAELDYAIDVSMAQSK